MFVVNIYTMLGWTQFQFKLRIVYNNFSYKKIKF